MDRITSQDDLENGITKSINGQLQGGRERFRGSSKSLDETFFAKVLDNLIPFDEEEKVGLIKNKISDGEENIKKEISMTESTNKKIKKIFKTTKATKTSFI